MAARLLKYAGVHGEDYQFTLMSYGLERLLYRLGLTAETRKLVLKGAFLFYLWTAEHYRPTRDVNPGNNILDI